jgi:glycosyltransferase involved in cell wall biosynthesis
MRRVKNDISVIIPTCNRYEILEQNINNVVSQKVGINDIIICDDSDKDYAKINKSKIDFLKKYPLCKYFYCAKFDIDGNKDYGLARSRNFGIVHALGEILVFIDDRLTPNDENSIGNIVKPLINNPDKIWTFGNKGSDKKSFVENWSAIRRANIIRAGSFFERIDKYGGMTREVFARFSYQGFKFEYVGDAMAKQLAKSSNWDKKDKEVPEMRSLLEKLKLC